MVKVAIHGTGEGSCSLTGRQADGLTVTFDGDRDMFLSTKSFLQLVRMKLGQSNVPARSEPTDNGEHIVALPLDDEA